MDYSYITFLPGGLLTALALAAGMLKPWRGLALLWLLGAAYGISGFAPQLEAGYFAVVIALGAILLAVLEQIRRYWRQRQSKAWSGFEQLLLGSFTVFILAGIFLGPSWGIALGGGLGGLGALFLQRYDSLASPGWALVLFLTRGAVLLLVAVFLNGRILAFF